MPRYEEADFGREPARGIRRERDGRDVREREPVREVRDTRGERRTMEAEPQQRLPGRMIDADMMGAREQQQRVANAGVPRQDPRAVRNVAPPRDLRDREDEMMFDARPPQFVAAREPAGARRTPYEGEFDDIPASVRPVIDPGRSRDEPRPSYNEYFLPGDGIDREVIQSEICRYLGQDATCKPGTHNDGRRGYIIRAYRALTTEMIRSLKEDSVKYGREKENAVRRNRQPATFVAFRDQTRYGGDEMMIDEPEDRFSRYEEAPRLRAAAPPSTYSSDYGASTAYYPVTQPPPPGVDPRNMDPRYVPGNATPPAANRGAGYAQAGYAPVTRPATNTIPAGTAFIDARGNMARDPGYGAYQPDPRARHHR